MSKPETKQPELLNGEGQLEYKELRRYRQECEECGEDATVYYSYLLPNARHNTKSSGYGRDSIVHCSDHKAFYCREHAGSWHPPVKGYEDCGRVEVGGHYDHLFLYWHNKDVTPDVKKLVDAANEVVDVLSDSDYVPDSFTTQPLQSAINPFKESTGQKGF